MTTARPNVLIITTHDSGRHFGCYGVPTVRTPNVDRLAADGVLFPRMFAASPICSPSRGALLTGRYPIANGLVGLAGGSWNRELHDYRQHLSHVLRGAGYQTAMFGLQHETRFPERLGFDDLSAHGVGGRGTPARPALEIARRAAAFFHTRGPGAPPFYAQVGFHETHTPYGFADVDGLNFSVRTDRFKLIRNLVPVDSTGRVCAPHELYDLERDPLEPANVADEPAYADAGAGLIALLDQWLLELDDPSAHAPIAGADHNAMLAAYRAAYEQRHGARRRHPAGAGH